MGRPRGPNTVRRTAHAQEPRLTPRQWRIVRQAAVTVALAGTAIVLAAAGLLVGAAAAIGAHLPSVDALYDLPSEATRIYSSDGQLIASLYRENRDSVPLGQVASTLQRAVIDTEDADFYRHRGFSLRGVVRASLRNLEDRGYAEGGSTITQQLARNMFLTSEKSLTRKIAEILLAVQIERRLTKDEILERYLNQVYFGQGAYGVETAAEVYFGKPAASLSLPESAMLAGLIRAPSYYSPYEHLDRGRTRMGEVLLRMTEQGDITPAQMHAAEHAHLRLAAKTNAGLIGIRAPYFVSYILPGLLQRYGEEMLYKGGLRVYTTLDLRMQAAADGVVRSAIEEAKHDHLQAQQGAMVAIDPRNGYVRAMIGGYDFRTSQFNRAWQAHRQPGSAFKPFTYTVAVMRGIPPTRMLLDAPIEFPMPDGSVWKPENYDKKWHGSITARYALENSINVASIRLEQQVGPRAIVDLAHRMGIGSPLQPNLSLTLGASDVTLLELVSAYGVFANGGVRAAPVAVTRVTDYHGKVLEEHAADRHVVLSPEVAYVMTDMLKGVVQRGTGTAANIGIPQAGKTGTADDYRNAWFIGFTPSIVAGVWVGNDDDSPMNKVTGGSLPARTWAAFMKQILPLVGKDDWTSPDGVVQGTVCATDASAAGCTTRPEVFIRGTEPEGVTAPAAPATPSPDQPAAPPGPSGVPVPADQRPATMTSKPAGTPAPAPAVPAVVTGAPGGSAQTIPPAAPDHATVPVVITAPRHGSDVDLPLTITGASPPGTLVHLTVTSESGAIKVEAANVYVRTDQSGTFSYQVNPWLRPSGGTLVITAAATAGPDGAAISGTATVTVRIK
ncbi:MAG TPA: PBP1A family penicillin-binding protein [bacterium]|nr:PBP1A family penicillin-binding protein [bacterium]